jgi:hypothetical protein
MKNTFLFLVILLILGLSYTKKEIKQIKEDFSSFAQVENPPVSARIFLNSVEEDSIFGSGTFVKNITSDGILSLQVEANLPLNGGGDFNNTDVIYKVFIPQKGDVMILNRSNDGFYRGEVHLVGSKDDYKNIEKVVITAEGTAGLKPVLAGIF